jgi:hypothetical protein
MQCGFCQSTVADHASVCPACRRDIEIPATLAAELFELVTKRNQLSQALDAIKLKLVAHG